MEIKQEDLEKISMDVSSLKSISLSIQREAMDIVEDKERYENVAVDFREKNIIFDLAQIIWKMADTISNDVEKLIYRGGEISLPHHKPGAIVEYLRK